ncbi:NAD/NADP-dependent octopine/nopaline dehydrogenase family protein [Tepidibacter aestuarii]|uniref:NAD/NADP-dependent octopine/nopaline dehydrogenase family protein n=1 Tax=Tepidibacter aestuarii TaxID=2925782 RepID=UPI0020BEBFFA|nr:NAD/NADP-dependent octopine/nopaline dehydrogenase family protein [Tepidibacter aestuarii]CAH2212095.1 Opine dehydrogenase Odh [Tepidibacter aestuarii]
MKNNNKKLNWAIIGGGNGGQSMAGHIGIKGFPVKLYDINKETTEAINDKGGIYVDGAVKGFGKVDLASTDISKVLEDSDIVVVVLPSLYHASIARKCAPHLKNGQIILIHPGSTLGALEFKHVLEQEKCSADVVVAEAHTLLYACRATEPGRAYIFGVKNSVMTAALPATENKRVIDNLNIVFPQFKEVKNVIKTSLENTNAMMHPGPSLLNTSKIESQEDWLYYYDGITPSIGAYVEKMDKERVEIGKAFGVKITPIKDQYREMYDAKGETLTELVRTTKAYDGIKGQKTLKTRYILEDIPNSLLPIVSLGKMTGVNVDKMETIVKLAKHMLGDDIQEGRTLENVGIQDLSVDELIEYVETGIKK